MVKVLIIFLALAIIVILIMLSIIRQKDNDIEYYSSPVEGEERNGHIYVSIDSKIYDDSTEGVKIGTVADFISTDFRPDTFKNTLIDFDYTGTSKAGRFEIVCKGKKFWVQPQKLQDEYTIKIEKKS